MAKQMHNPNKMMGSSETLHYSLPNGSFDFNHPVQCRAGILQMQTAWDTFFVCFSNSLMAPQSFSKRPHSALPCLKIRFRKGSSAGKRMISASTPTQHVYGFASSFSAGRCLIIRRPPSKSFNLDFPNWKNDGTGLKEGILWGSNNVAWPGPKF